ncbi:signal peptidase I [Kineococcus radiotolerans]|uniref:signal peptidase I n=1 Tax=Kineococcus radiotolerans TaxID=131568 RepID=UPI00161E766E
MIGGVTGPDRDDEPPGPPRRGPAGRAGARGLVATARETALVVAVALVVSMVVKTFLLQAFFIPSESMEPTLAVGDRVVVSKLTPGPFPLQRGDVVVFADPGGWLPPTAPTRRGPVGTAVTGALTFVGLLPDDADEHLVKRVVGLPGDHVACCDGQGRLTVDGAPLDESAHLAAGVAPSEQPFDVTVPPGELWVMGDNRPRSCDSRCHADGPRGGFVPLDLVTGRAVAVVWPPGHLDRLSTPDDDGGAPGAP